MVGRGKLWTFAQAVVWIDTRQEDAVALAEFGGFTSERRLDIEQRFRSVAEEASKSGVRHLKISPDVIRAVLGCHYASLKQLIDCLRRGEITGYASVDHLPMRKIEQFEWCEYRIGRTCDVFQRPFSKIESPPADVELIKGRSIWNVRPVFFIEAVTTRRGGCLENAHVYKDEAMARWPAESHDGAKPTPPTTGDRLKIRRSIEKAFSRYPDDPKTNAWLREFIHKDTGTRLKPRARAFEDVLKEVLAVTPHTKWRDRRGAPKKRKS